MKIFVLICLLFLLGCKKEETEDVKREEIWVVYSGVMADYSKKPYEELMFYDLFINLKDKDKSAIRIDNLQQFESYNVKNLSLDVEEINDTEVVVDLHRLLTLRLPLNSNEVTNFEGNDGILYRFQRTSF